MHSGFRELVQISIHAPTRGATSWFCTSTAYLSISIHAPTRGATLQHFGKWEYTYISIHAPTRGATPLRVIAVNSFIFQSTLPRGERLLATTPIGMMGLISIHAPTRGATMWEQTIWQSYSNFNPRSHEGSDRTKLFASAACTYFNPRSHEGSDSNFRQKVLFSLSKNCLKYLILTTNYFN